MGDIVTERLVENFTDLMDYSFTARMEEALDDIANGGADWKALLNQFYNGFVNRLEIAQNPESGMRPNAPTATDIPCQTCGREMMIRTWYNGRIPGLFRICVTA